MICDLSRETVLSLRAYPLEPATPGQQRIIDLGLALARDRGLRIDPHVLTTVRVPVDDPVQRGEVEFGHGRFVLRLAVAIRVMPDRLVRTLLHECQHLADAIACRPFDRAEWELRAIAFAAEAEHLWHRRQAQAAVDLYTRLRHRRP